MPPTFVLASGSPRRRELLGGLGVTFTVVKSDLDETQHPGEAPIAYAQRLSAAKAEAVHEQVRAAATDRPLIIIAADTIVVDLDRPTTEGSGGAGFGSFAGEVLGKPVDAADARRMLTMLRGRAHLVCTSVTIRKDDGAAVDALTQPTLTWVFMRDYSDAEIDAYIATGDPFDKAGGYAIQHPGFRPVSRVHGSETNVIGLPVETLTDMLRAFDVLP